MKRILSIGQCGFDHGQLARFFSEEFGAAVVGADSEQEAREELEQRDFDLILVNRKLDSDHSDGVSIIRRLKADEAAGMPVMLVSNLADAQETAIAAGAERGFGKAELSDPGVMTRLAKFLDDV